MTDFNIVQLETQNGGQDWPLIVMAVACPVCNAPIGERCTNLRDDKSMLHAAGPRVDWHAERKYAAAKLWYEKRDAPPVVEKKSTKKKKKK